MSKRTVFIPLPDDYWEVHGQANYAKLIKQHWQAVRGMTTRELRHTIDHIHLIDTFRDYLDWTSINLDRTPHLSTRWIGKKWYATFVCRTTYEATKFRKYHESTVRSLISD